MKTVQEILEKIESAHFKSHEICERERLVHNIPKVGDFSPLWVEGQRSHVTDISGVSCEMIDPKVKRIPFSSFRSKASSDIPEQT
jgi:hypothetical protein